MDHFSRACSLRLPTQKRLCLQFTIWEKRILLVFIPRGTRFSRFPRDIFVHIKREDLLKCPLWWYNQICWRKYPGWNKCKKHQNQRDFSLFLKMQINHLWQVEMKKTMKNNGGNCKSKQAASEQKWNAKRKDFRIKRVTSVIRSTAQGEKIMFRRATELNVMRRKHSMRCTL